MRALTLAAAVACVVLADHAARAAGKFDGVYEGEGVLRSGRCARPENPRYLVADSHISRPFGGGGAQVEATIGPDGKITNADGAIRTTTTGSIAGNALSMDIVTPSCTFHYELTKKG